MGIFSIFSSKKKAEPEAPAQIDVPEKIYYADVPVWLDSALSERLGGISRRASDICASIMSSKEKLKERIETLGKQNFDPQDKTYAKVNMAKDTFVKKALSELNGTSRPRETSDYKMLCGFLDSALSALDSIKKATPKQAILISNYFKKQSSEMVAGIKEMETAAAGLSRLIDGDGKLLNAVKEAKGSAAKLAELEIERRVDDINLSKASVSESAIGNRISVKQRELEALMESNEWKGYAESLGKISEMEARMKSVEQDANNRLSVLRRPMKKLSHDRDVAGMPENPFREIILTGGSIEGIVKTVLEAVSAGEIALKPSEREKIMALDDASLSPLKDSYGESASARGMNENSIDAALLEKKKSLESEITSLKSDSQRARKEVEFIEEKARRNNEEKQKRLKEIRRAVQEAVGKEVNITLQKDSGKA